KQRDDFLHIRLVVFIFCQHSPNRNLTIGEIKACALSFVLLKVEIYSKVPTACGLTPALVASSLVLWVLSVVC
ncbi:hypothetical protein, partial [Kingella denitrificans]|uniref:hypothetical protein n=1 Tax=Kingella denitrificans TaxID=502 RepID=UPI001C54F6F4